MRIEVVCQNKEQPDRRVSGTLDEYLNLGDGLRSVTLEGVNYEFYSCEWEFEVSIGENK